MKQARLHGRNGALASVEPAIPAAAVTADGVRKPDPKAMRLLRFLAKGTASVTAAGKAGMFLLDAGERGTVAVEISTLDRLKSLGAIEAAGGAIGLSPIGRGLWQAAREYGAALSEARREIEVAELVEDGTRREVLTNLAESPLAQLWRRRDRDGNSFLTADEFDAGERLRADYTRGQIMPRVGANWTAAVASGKRHGVCATLELTDAALGARLRVEKALTAVGPELSGVLVDVCCYLKGLERVEAERGWPVRSAKIVLKSALGSLNRHYRPQSAREAMPRGLHWGAQGYRPTIDGV